VHVELHSSLSNDPQSRRAADLIGACVHCGFCLATCPTYLDQADERDSPRGRIYLIKQLLETGAAGDQTRTHLDRCLTCRSCETTCPSGMQYGQLVDIGREMIEQHAPRPVVQRVLRGVLRKTLSRPGLFALLLRLGQSVRALLPAHLKHQIPPRQSLLPAPVPRHRRTLLALDGCVQQAATPRTNNAASRILDRLGITLQSVPSAGCCGAVNYHLGAHGDGLDDMRRNIDAWWPHIEAGAEGILSSATGCGSMLAEYGALLSGDPLYAEKARVVSTLCRDIAEVIHGEDIASLAVDTGIGKVAIHTPCSQQHALQQPALVRDILAAAGFELAQTVDDHLCCGSAGTYSILQAATSERLRERKLRALTVDHPAVIATANVGCQLHLTNRDGIRVCHWIELLDSP